MNTVTVAITTTGRPHFLRTALQSVQNQVGSPAIVEVLVSENSEDRRTEEVTREFPNLPIRYLFRQPTLPMLPHLFSTYRQARTPYVAILNDDDWWSASHLADGLRALTADPAAAAYAAASLFVVSESHNNPRWIDRTAAAWLLAGQPAWLTAWTLSPARMLALCWVYTPFHMSSVIARAEHLTAAVDELEPRNHHFHTIDRLLFARLALGGDVHYNPVADTCVRWHAGNWIKTQAARDVRAIIRTTVDAVEDMARDYGCDPVKLWKDSLSSIPAELAPEVAARFLETFTRADLHRHGLDEFLRRRPPSRRRAALLRLAGSAKRLVLGD